MFKLTVLDGPEAGNSLLIREGSLSIGKSPANQLVLSDPFVSRHHGQILWTGRHYVYVDLQSSNGSAVRRGESVVALGAGNQAEMSLEDADHILLGDRTQPTTLCFDWLGSPEAEETEEEGVEPSRSIKDTTIISSWQTLEDGLKSDSRMLSALCRLTLSLIGTREGEDLFQNLAEALLDAFAAATHVFLIEALGAVDCPQRATGTAGDLLPDRGEQVHAPKTSKAAAGAACVPSPGKREEPPPAAKPLKAAEGTACEVRLLMARCRAHRRKAIEDLPLSRSLIAKAVREGTGIHFSGVNEITPTSRSLIDAQIYSGILVPIARRHGATCVMQVDNRGGGQPFSRRDLDVLTVFSVHASRILDLFSRMENLSRRATDLAAENIRLKLRIRSERGEPEQIVGVSAAMQEIFRQLEKVKDLPTTVLIQGETGTGKELVARALHFNSRRRASPFVAQNCAALPETLLDSELFGHRKGAFTGATEEKKGLFELADRGTLLLDELSEMSSSTQAKLLRVIEDGSFRRLGGEKERRCRVRVIGATNRELAREVEEGRFRRDLYYRLNTVTISISPLRDRKEDIPVLCGHLLERIARRLEWPVPALSAEALELLLRHDFPGNVRELENILEAAVIQAGGRGPGAEHLPAYLRRGAAGETSSGALRTADQLRRAKEETGRDLERRFVVRLLEEHRGVVKAAAGAAGMNRSHFHQLLAKLGIDPAAFKGGGNA